MSGIIGNNNIRGSGIVRKLTSSMIPDDGITLAKLASGTDGTIITYDASGNPSAVGPGSDGEILTSTGAGSPPAFEAAGGFDVTSITGATALGAVPATTDEFVISDAGTLKRVDFNYIKGQHRYAFCVYKGAATNITTNTSTLMDLSDELHDPDGVFTNTAGNYKWTCPETGHYYFCASFHPYLANTGMKEINLTIKKNGGWTRWGHAYGTIVHSTTTGNQGNVLENVNANNQWSDDYTAGDYVQVFMYHYIHNSAAGTVNVTYAGNHFLGWRVD